MTSRFIVDFTEDTIMINYDNKEFLHWIDTEWIEDSSVVLSIANAIYLSQRYPEQLIAMFPDKI